MTKEQILMILTSYLYREESILRYCDSIRKLREELRQFSTEEEEFQVTSAIKGRIQQEANDALDRHNGIGAILAATGVGKTKIAIDRIDVLLRNPEYLPKTLLVVPTEKLRDEGWKNEFIKWDLSSAYLNCVESTCYASLYKYKYTDWDMIILDEFQNITEKSAKFFFNQGNSWKSMVALSATKPNKLSKIQLLKRIGIFPVYEITLDQAIDLGIAAPYEITLINIPLDNVSKYIEAGKAGSKYFITEKEKYDQLSKLIYTSPEWARMQRMTFITQLESKTIVAKWLLEGASSEYRMLIFCGTKKQADMLCEYRYYSKPTKPKKPSNPTKSKLEKYEKAMQEYEIIKELWSGDRDLIKFQSGEINRLACCDALNEGHNIADDLDLALITQMYSTMVDLLQRLGRILRFRPGHIGKLVVLYMSNTIEKDWVYKAISGLDKSKIRDVSIEDIYEGKETIFLN